MRVCARGEQWTRVVWQLSHCQCFINISFGGKHLPNFATEELVTQLSVCFLHDFKERQNCMVRSETTKVVTSRKIPS